MPSVPVPAGPPAGIQAADVAQALLGLAGPAAPLPTDASATPAPAGSADGPPLLAEGGHPWLSLLASPTLASWGDVTAGQGSVAGVEGPFRDLEDLSDAAGARGPTDHLGMPEHPLVSGGDLPDGAAASDAAANDFQAALALISGGSIPRPTAPGFSGDPYALVAPDPLRTSNPWVTKPAGTSDVPRFLDDLDDLGPEGRLPYAASLFGGPDRAGMPAAAGAYVPDRGSFADPSHWLAESGEGYALWNFHLAAEGLPGHGSTPPLLSSAPPTGYTLSVDPSPAPGALQTTLDAADARRLGSDRGEATAGRLSRPEVAPPRAVLDPTVLSHPDGSAEAGTVREPGRTASSLSPVAPSGQGAGTADPPSAAFFGAPSGDRAGPGGRLFVGHPAPAVVVPGRVVVPAVANSGGAGAADDGAEARTSPAPTGGAALKAAAQPAALLDGGLPFDLPALRQEVDAFFARLGALDEPGAGVATWARFVPWLVLLSAAAAVEFVRRRENEGSPRPLPPDHVLLGATFLPERE